MHIPTGPQKRYIMAHAVLLFKRLINFFLVRLKFAETKKYKNLSQERSFCWKECSLSCPIELYNREHATLTVYTFCIVVYCKYSVYANQSIHLPFPTRALERARHVFGTSCFLPLKSLQVIHQRDEITWQMSWQGWFCRSRCRQRAVMRNALGPLRPGTKVSTTICTSHKTPENIQMQICQEKK